MDRVGPCLAYRERAAGFDDGSTERKALAFGGRQKVGLEFHGGMSVPAGISVNAAMPQALSRAAVMTPP